MFKIFWAKKRWNEQWEPENSEILRRILDSRYEFK